MAYSLFEGATVKVNDEDDHIVIDFGCGIRVSMLRRDDDIDSFLVDNQWTGEYTHFVPAGS